MIKRLYECFSELFIQIKDIDRGDQIAELTGIDKHEQQEAFVNACESIDSLNSNLQLYFGYLDITPPAVAGAAGAAGAAEAAAGAAGAATAAEAATAATAGAAES